MPRRAKLCAAASLALLMIATASAIPASADIRTFGNWLVGCDNKAECAVLVTPADPPDAAQPAVVLRIGVDRTPLSGVELAIVPLPNRDPAGRPITVTCLLCANGLSVTGHEMVERVELYGQPITMTGMQGAKWLDALSKGRRIAVSWLGHVSSTTIDTSAFSEAWKHLAQTRGDRLRQASIQRSLPLLHAGRLQAERQRAFPAREVIPSGIPSIERSARTCPSGVEPERSRQFALPGNATLWVVQCRQGGTLTTHWYQASGGANLPSQLELPDGDRGQLNAAERGFEDSVFDFDFGILRARSGPADREDCGVQRAWGWDGGAWFLLERREMPACIGLPPSDWIRTYSSP